MTKGWDERGFYTTVNFPDGDMVELCGVGLRFTDDYFHRNNR